MSQHEKEIENITLTVVKRRITALLERITEKVNKCIDEECSFDIEFNIPKFVNKTIKNLYKEIEEEKIENVIHAVANIDINNKKEVMGVIYKKKGGEGDFEVYITSGSHEDALFLFSEDEKRAKWKRAGAGMASIRKYNKYALPDRPRSCGIVTGLDEGYTKLTDHVKKTIDASINDAREIINKYGYQKIYYSCKPNGMIDADGVGEEVISYITEQISSLCH